jgi:hypothetical protein
MGMFVAKRAIFAEVRHPLDRPNQTEPSRLPIIPRSRSKWGNCCGDKKKGKANLEMRVLIYGR